jgi:hypothetical protein
MEGQMTHYIYVIGTIRQSGKLGSPIKVGITANPNSRLSAIRTSCPNRIDFAHLFRVREREAASYFEKNFHSLWSEASLSGEWFDAEPEDAIIDIASELERGIIHACAQSGEFLDGIKKCLDWAGVTDAKHKSAAASYIRVWERQAA